MRSFLFYGDRNPIGHEPYTALKTPLTMIVGLQDLLKVRTDLVSKQVHVRYRSKTQRTIFDICDYCGRILKSGNISRLDTSISIADLAPDSYIFLILDGDRAISRRFTVRA